MNLDELQNTATEIVEEFDELRGGQHDSDTTLIHIVEELGELAREVYNEKGKRGSFSKKNFEGEIADMVMLLAHLAKCHGINLTEAVEGKVKELKERHAKLKQLKSKAN